jgi:hypothetical protein
MVLRDKLQKPLVDLRHNQRLELRHAPAHLEPARDVVQRVLAGRGQRQQLLARQVVEDVLVVALDVELGEVFEVHERIALDLAVWVVAKESMVEAEVNVKTLEVGKGVGEVEGFEVEGCVAGVVSEF